MYAPSSIAGSYPEEVFPAVEGRVGAIRSDEETARTNGLAPLGEVASDHPEAAEAVADDLAALLENRGSCI